MSTTTGNFRLVVIVGKSEVPAHNGSISRDSARKLQRVWRAGKPEAVTRVRKAV